MYSPGSNASGVKRFVLPTVDKTDLLSKSTRKPPYVPSSNALAVGIKKLDRMPIPPLQSPVEGD